MDCQSWQHLPDYSAHHAALVTDSALPGKWQLGEGMAYLLLFEGDMLEGDDRRVDNGW